MRRARTCLLLVVALASLAALSGGLPEGTAGAATAPAAFAGAAFAASSPGAPPWETAGPYPAAFDLRAEGRLTPVRSQDSYSTCWIMAAMGSLESVVLRKEGLPLDFSENNLANHMSSRLDFEGMAPSELALAYYARWEGPVRESSDPYPRPGKSPPYLRAVRHLQEALFLPERQGPLDNDAVKWAVMTHGGVDAAVDFRVQDEFESWNASTFAYYNASRSTPNHHILVVGWDDAYPAVQASSRGRGLPATARSSSRTAGAHDFADHGYLLGLLPRRHHRGRAGGVLGRRARGQLRRRLPVRRARPQPLDHGRRRGAGVVRQPLHRRRRRSRGGGLVLRARARHDVPGARRARPAGCRGRPGRRRRGPLRGGVPHGAPGGAGRGDGGGDVRGRRPRDDAGLGGARARGGAVRPHLSAGARGAVVRERRRFVVDGPDEPHGPVARQRVPQGVRGRRRRRRQAGRRGWRSAATWCGAARRR